ncbi:DUF6284 family protein [Actinoplanes sp. NPDC089786]|uniref:DUF6284 family protein n=1 Tax=Actinoplanes sp. NPDC089786 TaxID=3155185 RepID=UPI0034382C6C
MSHTNPGFAVDDLVKVDGDRPDDDPWTITEIVTDNPKHDGPYALLRNENGERSWSALRILWHVTADFGTAEPSPCELAAIEAEWPQIEKGLAELDAEIQALYAADRGLSELDWRRKRRREARLTRGAAPARSVTALRPAA